SRLGLLDPRWTRCPGLSSPDAASWDAIRRSGSADLAEILEFGGRWVTRPMDRKGGNGDDICDRYTTPKPPPIPRNSSNEPPSRKNEERSAPGNGAHRRGPPRTRSSGRRPRRGPRPHPPGG